MGRYRTLKQADVAKFLAGANKRSKTLKRDYQDAALAMLEHTAKTGDYTSSIQPMLEQAKAIFGTSLDMAFCAWVLGHSPLVRNKAFNPKAERAEGNHPYTLPKGWKAEAFDIEAAEAEPFWEREPQKREFTYDLDASVEAFVKRAGKAVEKRKVKSMTAVRDAVLAKLAESIPNDPVLAQFATNANANTNEDMAEAKSA